MSHLEDACFALDVEILYGDQVTHFIVKCLILTFFQDCTHFLCSLLIINWIILWNKNNAPKALLTYIQCTASKVVSSWLFFEVNVFLVKSLHFARLLSSVIGGAEETRRLDSRSWLQFHSRAYACFPFQVMAWFSRTAWRIFKAENDLRLLRLISFPSFHLFKFCLLEAELSKCFLAFFRKREKRRPSFKRTWQRMTFLGTINSGSNILIDEYFVLADEM